ncbi:Putative LOC100870657 [Caligus rogercresseyi]|uniref:LOC100870657 n=1 Tax=Caligus rogercresseyi TaxID=217165 RepID=A0A7T8GUA3_CALRO|nr:Putative LOC100870657 [Caligus rogercresseyi]
MGRALEAEEEDLDSDLEGRAVASRRPKTEDFLTFLCLRGTDLLPPELDFFRKQQERSATILSTTEDQEEDKTEKESHEQESDSEDEETRGEEEARLQSKKVFQGKKKSSSVQALKRKYVAQRLAKQESRRVHVKPSSKAQKQWPTKHTTLGHQRGEHE